MVSRVEVFCIARFRVHTHTGLRFSYSKICGWTTSKNRRVQILGNCSFFFFSGSDDNFGLLLAKIGEF